MDYRLWTLFANAKILKYLAESKWVLLVYWIKLREILEFTVC